MQEIVEAGHNVGARVGFDLAHAIGNVEMKLHEWQVDLRVGALTNTSTVVQEVLEESCA